MDSGEPRFGRYFVLNRHLDLVFPKVLPFEPRTEINQSDDLPYSVAIQQGQNAEFADSDLNQAISHYSIAISLSNSDQQRSNAIEAMARCRMGMYHYTSAKTYFAILIFSLSIPLPKLSYP